jgi:predicted neuraminidase
MKLPLLLLFFVVCMLPLSAQPGLLEKSFIYTEAPYPECHASTLVETPSGILAAWFGGTSEKDPDVGIWLSRREGDSWSEPVEVADGVQHADKRYPTWNPVLQYDAGSGQTLLFYKVGPTPSNWWGMLMTSDDDGKTWSQGVRLPEDILGPVKNKAVQRPDGSWLCGSSTEHDGWRVHMEITPDQGKSWERVGPLSGKDSDKVIQPTIFVHGPQKYQILCRTKKSSEIMQSWSEDGGLSWSDFTGTSLPNPNSGLDGVTLADGRHLLVYNHTQTPKGKWGGPRSPLNVAISSDGIHWEAVMKLETDPGEYSYPAVVQTADGMVHITYTWKRERVRYVVLDPAKLVSKAMVGSEWPE